MVESSLPVTVKWGDDGEIVRLLIHEKWFDKLTPIYRYFKEITSAVSITEVPEHIDEFLMKSFELINSLHIEFGTSGWIFSLSLIYILHRAAREGATIGKFVYAWSGAARFGKSRFGNSSFGGPSTRVVKEIE